MDRREFLQRLAALGILAGAGKLLTFPPELLAMAPAERPEPLLAQASGTNYAHLVGDTVQTLGGIKKFVNPNEVVVVKPNMAWDRPPELGANTHPVVVRKIVELCLEAGAKKVKVLDHTCHDARRAYANSGIKAAVEEIKDPRAVVEYVDERKFVEMNVPQAKSLKKWYFYKDILEADRFINVPVAKHHSEARLTMAMKNMMGAIGGWRGRIHVGLHQNIADMNLLLRADLTILDATRIMTQGGPSGGKPEYVQVKNLVIAGVDPVAIDAYSATTLFGLQPQDIGYINKGHEMGLGEMDLKKIKVLSA
ncbi:MAG: DUF362 domain-containing protein [Desulfobacca sp.]|uniref:DUF362 domain-containing protein n=1 Tax=Desulfobacca sp. TaxID=2067990 RepID=UPI00404ADDFC